VDTVSASSLRIAAENDSKKPYTRCTPLETAPASNNKRTDIQDAPPARWIIPEALAFVNFSAAANCTLRSSTSLSICVFENSP
jgi:hypothetical protein